MENKEYIYNGISYASFEAFLNYLLENNLINVEVSK